MGFVCGLKLDAARFVHFRPRKVRLVEFCRLSWLVGCVMFGMKEDWVAIVTLCALLNKSKTLTDNQGNNDKRCHHTSQ